MLEDGTTVFENKSYFNSIYIIRVLRHQICIERENIFEYTLSSISN
jgi:hypothetical protein